MSMLYCVDGTVFYVSKEDAEEVSKVCWYALRKKRTTYVNSPELGYLHRFLLSAPKGLVVDHIDGDGLNNVRENLRLCERHNNSHNSRKPSNNTSGVKGVSLHKPTCKWRADIQVRRKQIFLGLYETIEQAEVVVKAARAELHGAFANHGEET